MPLSVGTNTCSKIKRRTRMPLCGTVESVKPLNQRYVAVVAVAAFNASHTIEPTLRSIVNSIHFHAVRRAAPDRIAISIVDDASADQTRSIVASFARQVDVDVYLAVNEKNCGRGFSRNRALAVAAADH